MTSSDAPALSADAANLGWLLNSFVDRVPRVRDAVVFSADGLPMVRSDSLDRDSSDRFAAVASGLVGLAYGASERFGGGRVNEVIVEMESILLLVTGISDGSCLAVIAEADADLGLVGYEMAVFGEQAGAVLTPELRAELKATMAP